MEENARSGTTGEEARAVGENFGDVGLSLTKNGTVKQTISNCVVALRTDEKTQDMFRYNMLTDKIEVYGAWWNRSDVNISQTDENNIRMYLENTYELTSEKGVTRAIDILAHQNEYHPIRDYLNGLKWDGVSRIGELFPRYLGAVRCDYTTEATRLFLLGAIERVFHPGIKFDTMVCLVEDLQGGGKSSMARFLAIRDEWFSDDIRNLDDENVYRKLQGHWVIEFSEMLATSSTKTVEAIKSFLSRQKDVYKIPYDRYPHDIPRQCVFIGTTNNTDFLPKDRTGNRRFIPIAINSEAAERHPLENEKETREYVIQCYAEAMEICRREDYKLKLSDETMKELETVQEAFKPEDPKVGIIQSWLDGCNYDAVCSQMIFKEAFPENYYREPQRWELSEISSIMNKCIVGWKRYPTSDHQKRFMKYGKQRAWSKIVHEKASSDGFVNVDEQA